jgi:PAS domain S-box-containing protein/diguanylate cyclase (GGDEF)-like protein
MREVSSGVSPRAGQTGGNTRFETAFANAPIGMSVVSPSGRCIQANEEFCRLLDYDEGKLQALNVFDLVHPDDARAARASWNRLVDGSVERTRVEVRYLRRGGSEVWVAITSTMLRDAAGSPLYAVSQIEDISRTKEAEKARQVSERRYSELFERCNDLIVALDLDGVITSANPAAEHITGYTPAELVGRRLTDLVVESDVERAQKMIGELLDGDDETTELEVCTRTGGRVFIEISGGLVSDRGRPIGIEGIARDTTERHALQEALARRALYDSLTGLPNRELFLDRLTQTVARLKRPGETVAVMLLGFDVHKKRGKGVGDELLKELAPLLQQLLRGSDTVARLRGDEFGLIIENLQNEQQVMIVAGRILGTATESSIVGPMTASIGIALAEANSGSTALLENADTALHRAKKTKPGGAVVFSAEVHSLAGDRGDPPLVGA